MQSASGLMVKIWDDTICLNIYIKVSYRKLHKKSILFFTAFYHVLQNSWCWIPQVMVPVFYAEDSIILSIIQLFVLKVQIYWEIYMLMNKSRYMCIALPSWHLYDIQHTSWSVSKSCVFLILFKTNFNVFVYVITWKGLCQIQNSMTICDIKCCIRCFLP